MYHSLSGILHCVLLPPHWVLRTALVCTTLALTLPLYISPISVFFAVLTGAFCSMSNLGSTIRASIHVGGGSIIGGLLGALVVSVGGSERPSLLTTWVSILLLSPAILFPVAPLMTTKLSLALFLTSLLSTGEEGGGVEFIFKLIVGALLGCVAALVFSVFMGVRATKEESKCLTQAITSLARSVASSTSALSQPSRTRAALIRDAMGALRDCAEAVRAMGAHSLDAEWEPHASASFLPLPLTHWVLGRRPSPPTLKALSASLQGMILAAQGMVLSGQAAREGDESLADSAAFVDSSTSSPFSSHDPLLPRGPSTDAMDGNTSPSISTGTFLAQERLSLLAMRATSATMDGALAPPSTLLAQCAGEVLLWHAAAAYGCGGGREGEGEGEGGGGEWRLLTHLASLDTEFMAARKRAFYAPTLQQDGQAAAALQVGLSLHGVPPGRYLYVFSLKAYISSALAFAGAIRRGGSIAVPAAGASEGAAVSGSAAGSVGAAGAGTPRAPRCCPQSSTVLLSFLPPLPFTLSRLLYVSRLTAALAVAVLIGRAFLGSSVWAAAAIAFVGPRVNETLGGSFHASFLRIAGTVAGSVVGLLAVMVTTSTSTSSSSSSSSGPPLPPIPPPTSFSPPSLPFITSTLVLGVWVALVGLVRLSPRHAYGAAVAQFTGYLILLAPPGQSTAWAVNRITQNALGMAAFAVLELLVYPRRVAKLQRAEIGAGLRAAAGVVGGVEAAVVRGGGGGVGVGAGEVGVGRESERAVDVVVVLNSEVTAAQAVCSPPSPSPSSSFSTTTTTTAATTAATATTTSFTTTQALRASLAKQGELLKEASDESEWSALSSSALQAPLPEGATRGVLDSLSQCCTLLALMEGVMSGSEEGGGEMWRVGGVSHTRLVAPCSPALLGLLHALGRRYAALSEAVEGGRRGVGGGELRGTGEHLVASSRALTAALRAVFLSLVRERDKGEVGGDCLVRFVSLEYITRALVGAAEELGENVRNLK